MKYEIIMDSSDLVVLIVNSRIIAISQDIGEITRLLTEDYQHHVNKTRRAYDPVIMYPELDKNTKEPPKTVDEPANGALGNLFDL